MDTKKLPCIALRDRSLVVALVALLHVLILWTWLNTPGPTRHATHEMALSLEQPSTFQAAAKADAFKSKPRVRSVAISAEMPQSDQQAASIMPVVETAMSAAQTTNNNTPMQPAEMSSGSSDREPDRQALYLEGLPLSYPMVARKMGWQGKVVLNVEVLASGMPGQIKLKQSSGHEVLDKAALQAMRNSHFIPARHGGLSVSAWGDFTIPFVLKEVE